MSNATALQAMFHQDEMFDTLFNLKLHNPVTGDTATEDDVHTFMDLCDSYIADYSVELYTQYMQDGESAFCIERG